MGEADVAEALRQRVTGLAVELRRADRAVADDDPEGVHDLRVAMRRVRSLLRTFRPLLGAGSGVDPERLRDELRWASGELGVVRDLEVVHGALDDVVADESLPASVGARLARHRADAGAAARAQVAGLRRSARYARLLDDLDGLVAALTWSGVTRSSVRDVLRRDWRRLRRRAQAADSLAPGEDAEAALHEVRKAAKRARYAAETLTPALGDRAQQLAEVAEQVQDALGTHRDTLLTRDLLHRLAAEPGVSEEHVFALGRLHAREERRGAEALFDYAAVRLELDRKRYRRWLR